MSNFGRTTCQMCFDKTSNTINAMTIENEQMLFENALCERVRNLRDDRGWTAEQMATALGIPPDRYRKYENRSPLPQYLIPLFAQTVDRSIEYVLTGKERRQLPSAKRRMNITA